ncbi:hypothetical protein BCIN_05g01120 [Botrytis cinerea B05.10]|uniref:Uncharacterized protein n=1 Tax=Botryotinia fuckeliana (strain B05.10) TaxID=332648 RepID=A0A384JGH9_BOTFB|nr:hypothetical protein BCIN_05g01120 [Botrytis cinerea B05.10]ATZ49698.1 hypothetical protein BCIN_05g01120 [Botrytis cinerea B05.10]
MLIQETHHDVPTKAGGKEGSMRIFLFHPTIPNYPHACVVHSIPLSK